MLYNVCVSAVVRFRSRVLSHETKRGTKIKTYSLHLTAPLQKHFVAGWPFRPPWRNGQSLFFQTLRVHNPMSIYTELSAYSFLTFFVDRTLCVHEAMSIYTKLSAYDSFCILSSVIIYVLKGHVVKIVRCWLTNFKRLWTLGLSFFLLQYQRILKTEPR